MDDETLFEVEQVQHRSDIAASLQAMSDQLGNDDNMIFTASDQVVTVPARPSFEIEVEREQPEDDDDATELSIELEIEWEQNDELISVDPVEVEDAEDQRLRAVDADAVQRHSRFHVYKDRAGEWRWRLVHRNGNIIATSGAGYSSRQNAENGLRSVMKNAPGADVVRE